LLFTPVSNESDENLARIWKLPSLEPVAKIDSVPPLSSAAFLQGGERLLIGIEDGTLRVCDLTTMETTEIVEHTAWITDIGVSGDGKTFVTSSSDRTLVVWDALTLEVRARLRGHVGEVWSLSLSNDGHLLASGSADGTCKLWDVSTKPPSSVVEGRSIGIVDGHSVLVTTASDGLKMWNMESGEVDSEIPLIGVEKLESRLNFPAAVHSGGALVAIGLDENVELWNLKTGKRQGLLSSFENELNAVVFSSDGRLVAAGSDAGMIKVWDVESQVEIAQFGSSKRKCFALAFSPDSKRLASFRKPSLTTVWNLADGSAEVELHTKGIVNALAFSPDGQLLAAGVVQSNETIIWQIPSGDPVATLRGHVQGVAAIAFSPDGRTLATGSHDRLVKLWNLATQQEVATFQMDGFVRSLRFSGDGRVLAGSFFHEGGSRTKLWRAPSWEELAAGESEMGTTGN
jgi:WD40 repeat protein